MAISDFISTSFLFSIAIIVILIGGIFAYVSYRMSEQDHKITSMLGLVSTMADEIHDLKNKVGLPVNQHHHQQYEKYNNYEDDEEVGLKKHSLGGNPKLIHVSDDEDTSSETDEDESESEPEPDESESETETDESESDDSETDDLEADETEIDADDLENNSDNINLGNDINILDLEDMANEITEEVNETNTELVDLGNVNDIKSIHLAEPINMHLDELSAVEINNDLKTISISMTDIGMNINDFGDDSNKHKSVDYKKMSLNKLRDVVVEKGIIPDASKLKKNELLKLLGEE
jgi:hypothetical protein